MPEDKATTSAPGVSVPEVDKMSIVQLFGHLKIGQLWGTLAVIAGLIGGTFVAGYKTSSTVMDAQLNSMQIKLDDANANLATKATELTTSNKEIASYKKKDRFLSLFLRYEQEQFDDPDVRDALDEYVLKFIDESEKDESFVKFGKGQARQTTVTFWDGAKWTIPPDSRAAATAD